MSDAGCAVDLLRRWEQSGARWRILARTPTEVMVALLSCDSGEEVDRLHSTDPALLAYIGHRDSSDQEATDDHR